MKAISAALLSWFRRAARRMDWRETDDPYRIWVSEIMLQQTAVATVTPYYRRFLGAFPTVEALAGADADAVLKAWEGLGYYSRARNLHQAARIVVRDHGGFVPDDVDELRALPGIGRSTAGAIAAIAFRRDAPILDGNVKRVLARLFAVRGDVTRPAVQESLWGFSRGLVLPGTGRETALALMDLGATVCTPRRPDCSSCPLRKYCRAFRTGIQLEVPITPARRRRPRRDTVAAVIENGKGEFLIDRRDEKGLLGGLWEFPGGTRGPGETPEEALRRIVREELGLGIEILSRYEAVEHAYSHFTETLHGFRCRKTGGTLVPGRPWKWAARGKLGDYAFPSVHRKLIERIVSMRRGDAAPAARTRGRR